MAQGFASCFLILYLLFLMQSNSGNGHKEYNNNIKQIVDRPHSGDDENHDKSTNIENHSHANHHHELMFHNTDQLKNTMGVFTRDDELIHIGKKVEVQFFTKVRSSLSPILPKEEADRIPFSLNKLPQILQFFSISHGSQQAMAIEDTIKKCEAKPIEGETKICATSLESMVDFVSSILGKEHSFRPLRTTHLGKPSELYQNYTFLEVREVSSPKSVSCHYMPYPYAVLFCHNNLNTKVFRVLVAGEKEGDRVDGVVICHLNTTHWSKEQIAFKILHVNPGTVPVCHFLPNENHFVWVQNVV